MRLVAVPFALMLLTLTACASQDQMARNARISMPEAVRTAEASIPGGKAKKTHLEHEGDRVVYEIQLVDRNDSSRTVWVDAQTGRITKTD